MIIKSYKEPESSFLSVEKDTATILEAFIQNDSLNRLLYYNTSDALATRNVINEDIRNEIYSKHYKLVPTVKIDPEVKSYINIVFGKFTTSGNPQFRNNVISFDILCHLDDWELDDLKLRPYRIAAEIDSILKNIKLSNMGALEFMGADILILNDTIGGVTLVYRETHGGEDKYNPIAPGDKEIVQDNFDKIINGKDEEDWTID